MEVAMGKEKEGLITSVPEALTEAAKINMAAAKEMASRAVATFVDTVTGRGKPRRGKRRVSKKEASSAAKRHKAGSSAATTRRRAGRRTTAKALRAVRRSAKLLPKLVATRQQNPVKGQKAARVDNISEW
jgi:hypothetical protein